MGKGKILGTPTHRRFCNQDDAMEAKAGAWGPSHHLFWKRPTGADEARILSPSFKSQSNCLQRFHSILARADLTPWKTVSFRLGPKISKLRSHRCFIFLTPREVSIMARGQRRPGRGGDTYRDPTKATSNQNARPWTRPDCVS